MSGPQLSSTTALFQFNFTGTMIFSGSEQLVRTDVQLQSYSPEVASGFKVGQATQLLHDSWGFNCAWL